MHTALIFGYGQRKDGMIDEQTQDRCKKGAELYKEGKIQRIYLTVSASKNGISMADSMRDFLVSQSVKETDIVVYRRGGNTAGELDIFLFLAPRREKFTLISTWYHIPRIIWLAFWRIPPTRFTIGIAWRHAKFKGDILVEFLKLANAILRPKRSSKIYSHSPAIT